VDYWHFSIFFFCIRPFACILRKKIKNLKVQRAKCEVLHKLMATCMAAGDSCKNPTGSSIPRIPPLDGIRGFGIVCIVTYHVSQDVFPGAFVMVDMFFVLSGFLIAAIILSDLRRGAFSFREFYLRRMQRLLPNLLVTVLVTMLLWNLFFPPCERFAVGRHGLFSIFSMANVYAWRFLGGYWGDSAETAPLTHMWSLGLEEQFYLFFPTFFFLLSRYKRKNMTLWVGLVALVSFACSVLFTHLFASASFYLPPTRLWEMLAGALPALWWTPRTDETVSGFGLRQPVAELLGMAGLALIAGSTLLLDKSCEFPGYIAIVPISGTMILILSVADGGNRVSGALSRKPLVVLGKASYSLYLWHWPLITLGRYLFTRNGYPELYGAIAGCFFGVLFASLAYEFIEKPLRRRDSRRAVRLSIIFALIPVSAMACLTLVLQASQPDPGKRFDPVVFSGLNYSCGKRDDAWFVKGSRVRGVEFPFDKSIAPDLWREGGIRHLYGGNTPRVVVFGSSHAEMYSKVIDEICREKGISVAFLCIGNYSSAFYDACKNRKDLPNIKVAQEFDATRAHVLSLWHPDVVLVIDKWDRYSKMTLGFDERLSSFMDAVRSDVGHVVYVAQAPVLRGLGRSANLQEYVSWFIDTRGSVPVFLPDGNDAFRRQCTQQAMELARYDPQLTVMRPETGFYDPDGAVRYVDGRKFLYIDDNHLSDDGAEMARGLFCKTILRLVDGVSSDG
jgi:peptidoglycan/LPS O-acetylase OafA/YrhL